MRHVTHPRSEAFVKAIQPKTPWYDAFGHLRGWIGGQYLIETSDGEFSISLTPGSMQCMTELEEGQCGTLIWGNLGNYTGWYFNPTTKAA